MQHSAAPHVGSRAVLFYDRMASNEPLHIFSRACYGLAILERSPLEHT